MHPNIPDDILLKLKKKNAAIMIIFSSVAIDGLENGRTSIDKLIDHVMQTIKIIWIAHVGIDLILMEVE